MSFVENKGVVRFIESFCDKSFGKTIESENIFKMRFRTRNTINQFEIIPKSTLATYFPIWSG